MESRHILVDAVDTHYLHAGDPDAPVVVLLHGGAPGEAAETAWSRNIEALAGQHRVIAPDWLGFGRSAKVVDFGDRMGRMIRHLARLLEELQIGSADLVGLSMGGSALIRALVDGTLAARRAVLVSAGGPPISREAMARLAAYDGSAESMREQIRLACADPAWAHDEAYVARRMELAALPGAHEAFASLGLRGLTSPPPAPEPGYARIQVPVLLVAGALDRLKPRGFAEQAAGRIRDARLEVFDGCGHCPQLEDAHRFNHTVLAFLEENP
ncbi:alpha/beta fold hydrolase [Nonomuraea soli]|uniref:Pimeloyl-ACP methyl ester carboxylesterase n=1 Tax=Nonomuraea soli TaxID=1032476 RepID=A0A7W0CFN9_9ACTN|nr:alpha/beta fold hydrolase [Nonomuraea soli]MBA2890120.1 pimeloyl-ACP methyl ester carboxylesterase [Nonomuraea soli]